MVPFLTHVDGVRANLFWINPRQKITPTMINQQLFFFLRKIWCNKLFSFFYGRGTTYLSKNGPHHEKTCFCHMWTTKAQINLRIHAVCSAPLLFAAWIVTRFYSSKLYNSIGTYTVSPTRQFEESVVSLHVHLFKSKFHPVKHGSTVARTVMCRQDGRGWFPVLLDDLSKCRTNSQRKSQLS